MGKSLVDHYPEAKWFDKKRRIWYGESTAEPVDGILRLNTPYMLNCAEGVYENACPMGKWFIAPAHPEGSGCPSYMKPRQYAEMENYGRQVTQMLRHRYYDKKYNDGATMDANELASICTRQFRWPVSVRGLWQLAQEGQGDTKARVMVLIAWNHCWLGLKCTWS